MKARPAFFIVQPGLKWVKLAFGLCDEPVTANIATL
jgi:hypothetical protein